MRKSRELPAQPPTPVSGSCPEPATRKSALTGCTVYAIAHPCPMCLAALYHCAPDEVVFMATREATAPYMAGGHDKYFEPSTFYGEFGKPWDQRRLPMCYQQDDEAVEVYRLFQERKSAADS